MRVSSLVLSVSVLAVSPLSAAYAGFDWVPPAAPPPAASASAEIDTPSFPLEGGLSAPVESEAIAAIAPSAQTPSVDLAVVPSGPEAQEQAPVDITPPSAQDSPQRSSPRASKTAVYPPPGNLAAAPLKGNKTTADFAAPSRKAAAEPVWRDQPVAEDQETSLSSPPPAMRAYRASPSYSDQTGADFAVAQGFGKGIPLSVAMGQIIPPDFTVNYQDQPNPDTIVSWAGGRAWNKVLEDMLYAHGYRVMVANKTVTVFKAGRAASVTGQNLTPSAQVMRETIGVPVPAPTMAPSAPVSTAYQAQKVDIFSARAGEPAHEVLARWSKQASVELYWEAGKNFSLTAPVAFNATFARAVEQVLGQFRGLQARPVAELHPNAPTGPVVLSVRMSADQTLVVR